jgi:hypothetical protein
VRWPVFSLEIRLFLCTHAFLEHRNMCDFDAFKQAMKLKRIGWGTASKNNAWSRRLIVDIHRIMNILEG